MRERQNRQTDEDQDHDQDREHKMDEESGGPAPAELQHELRGVLLEEQQQVEDSADGTEEGGQEGQPAYAFT